MKSSKIKSIYILFGFIPGIAIGIVLALLIFDFKTKEVNSVTVASQNTILDTAVESKPVKCINEEKSKKSTSNNSSSKAKKEKVNKQKAPVQSHNKLSDSLNLFASDSINDTVSRELILHDSVKLTGEILSDSLYNDTIIIDIAYQDTGYENNSEENIVVIRDQLIDTRSAVIEGLSITANEYDSLLLSNEELSNINNNIYRIELWVSPVNFQGYKLAKNKVILYGINQYDSISFNSMNDSIFLNLRENSYLLEIDENFRQLIPLQQ